MLAITKNNRNPLQQYYTDSTVCYENIPTEVKEALKQSLIEEQGCLCAYCMSRIRKENMHIEHWYPQHPNPEPTTDAEKEAHRLRCIDYNNLLAVCSASRGQTKKNQHCDDSRENSILTYCPANPDHQARLDIHYEKSTGKIRSGDKNFDKDINILLNLNIQKFQNNRKSVIENLSKELAKAKNRVSKTNLENLLRNYKEKNNKGEFTEYAGVAIYFIEKRLAAI